MNSIYKKDLKVSIPTLQYIKETTALDLILEEGNKERAEGKVMSLTMKARDLLFSNKLPITQRCISYLIYKGDWASLWEQYVLRYIEATFYFGDESSWQAVPSTIINAINGSMLSVKRFAPHIEREVVQSTEDF